MTRSCFTLLTGLVLLLLGFLPAARGADELPANVGLGLRRLAAWDATQPRTAAASERRARLATALPGLAERVQTTGDARRAVVDVDIDGKVTPAAVSDALTALGATVFAQASNVDGGSTLSARLPLDQTGAAARLPGVRALSLVRRPHHWIGKATTQGASVLRVLTTGNAGSGGQGITVGVLSDSFNAATLDSVGQSLADHAADDVASGDLPGPGNPYGHVTPVTVLADADPADPANTDEGRAMLQIVHDLAPDANLVFCTNGATPAAFAANVRALRTNPAAPCDVLVDDAVFDEEPFFSDGPAARAVDEVVHSADLPGRPVLYYSAAGSLGADGSYDATLNLVADDVARASAKGNLKLGQVPAELTAGGFHSFDTRTGHVVLSQKVFVAGAPATLNFQWDDPWVHGLVSTTYSLLVFDAQGNYLPGVSGIEDSQAMGHAIQLVDLPLGANKTQAVYQLAIARRAAGLQQATHLRYLVRTEGAYRAKKFTPYNVPSIYGHAAAHGADAVAAFAYDNLAQPENNGSAGPVTICFDNNGNRLATPTTRLAPSFAAVDGVDTTFFPATPGADTDGDGLPNFYGTSAAAAHVAGIAARMLQAAGGPGSLSDAQVRSALQSTAAAHDLDPSASQAVATDADGVYTVTLAAAGDSSDFAAFDKAFFKLGFAGPEASELQSVTVNLKRAGEQFDPDGVTGFPFKVSHAGSTIIADNVAATFSGAGKHPAKMTLTFAPGTFKPGDTLAFGIDRDVAALNAGGNSADLLTGATVKARVLEYGTKTKAAGAFVDQMGTGYSPVTGAGLIDAAAALAAALGGS